MLKSNEKESVNSLYTDFRSDVTAAAMVDNGIEADSILVLRRLGTSRQTDKEIASVTRRRDHDNGGEVIEIRTNRPGMYDNLPEYLFHSGLELKQYSRESVLSSLRREQKREESARRLFSLYELEIERLRMGVSMKEIHHDRPVKHRALSVTVGLFWPVIRKMDSRTSMLFTHAIRYIRFIRDSGGDIAYTVAVITGLPVTIKPISHYRDNRKKSPRLGAMRLGMNSTLKGNSLKINMEMEVEVGEESLPPMLPGGEMRDIVERLVTLFLPNEDTCRVTLCPRPEAFATRIGKPDKPCLLGINARLARKGEGKIQKPVLAGTTMNKKNESEKL